AAVGRSHEIREETLALVRDLEHLARRPEMSQKTVARELHLREGRQSAGGGGAGERIRRPVVIGRPPATGPRRGDVTAGPRAAAASPRVKLRSARASHSRCHDSVSPGIIRAAACKHSLTVPPPSWVSPRPRRNWYENHGCSGQ